MSGAFTCGVDRDLQHSSLPRNLGRRAGSTFRGAMSTRDGRPARQSWAVPGQHDRMLKSLETDLLLIQPSSGFNFGNDTTTILTPGDAEAIARECRPAVKAVAPVVRARTRVVYRKMGRVPLYTYGTSPSFLDARGWGLERGRPFTDREVKNGTSVCLLGQTLVHELFGNVNPLDQTVRVNNQPLKVVGILSRKGDNVMGLDQDDLLLAPWTTVKDKVNKPQQSSMDGPDAASTLDAPLYPQTPSAASVVRPQVDQIVVKVAGEKEILAAVKQITALLRKRHHIGAGMPDDFNIRDMSEMARVLRSTQKLMK